MSLSLLHPLSWLSPPPLSLQSIVANDRHFCHCCFCRHHRQRLCAIYGRFGGVPFTKEKQGWWIVWLCAIYGEVANSLRLERQLDNIFIGNNKLYANLPEFGKRGTKEKISLQWGSKETKQVQQEINYAMKAYNGITNRSYAHVTIDKSKVMTQVWEKEKWQEVVGVGWRTQSLE